MLNNKERILYNENGICALSNNEIQKELKQRIRDNWGLFYGNEFHSTFEIKGRIWKGQELSKLFYFELNQKKNGKKNIFIKLCPEWETFNPGVLEYETLQLTYKRMQKMQSGFSVPRPIAFYSDLNAYAMESVGKANFKNYLLKHNSIVTQQSRISQLNSKMIKCAQWLETFHSITKSKKKIKFDTLAFLHTDADFTFQKLKDTSFNKRHLKGIENFIKQDLTKINQKFYLPCAKWHWDYTPAHVFFENKKLKVIDTTGVNNIPIYEDIGHFLAATSTINCLPLYPFFDYRRANDELCQHFIDGYLENSNYDKQEFLMFSNLYKLKYLMHWYYAQFSRIKKRTNFYTAKLFAKFILNKRFEYPLMTAIHDVRKSLKNI